MNLLEKTFASLGQKKALIPFITAGHPHLEFTVTAMHALVNNGADILELGIPFSDPMADGEVIQKSSEKAIRNGVGLSHVLQLVAEFREKDTQTPVVLMGYLNPIEFMGYQKFVNKAAKAGVSAVLLVDSPPEESADLLSLLKEQGLQQIFLLAPTTTLSRMKMISQVASGFIYYVALKGVTGSSDLDVNEVEKDVKAIKNISPLPVAVGFGVKDADSALAVAAHADAVVIGSALVQQLDSCTDVVQIEKTVAQFIRPIRKALDSI